MASELVGAVNAAGELLLGQATTQAREQNVPSTSALRITDSKLPTVADEIIEEATAHDVDLIVCGSHGKTGFRALILGSVAEGLIHRSHIPLLLIPTRPTQR
ncbi:universal stress family protein [mine drainage metagenome]